jgi:hypothetical protein
MSNVKPAPLSEQIAALSADNTEMRLAILALAQGQKTVQDAVAVALAPKARVARTVATVATNERSALEDALSRAGFTRAGNRATVFSYLFNAIGAEKEFETTLGQIVENTTLRGMRDPSNAITDVRSVARRIARPHRYCGFGLDVEERDANVANTVCTFYRKPQPALVSGETETDSE